MIGYKNDPPLSCYSLWERIWESHLWWRAGIRIEETNTYFHNPSQTAPPSIPPPPLSHVLHKNNDPLHVAGYESVFEKRAFGGELELEEINAYFHECDLYPAMNELDEAFDAVFRGNVQVLCRKYFFLSLSYVTGLFLPNLYNV